MENSQPGQQVAACPDHGVQDRLLGWIHTLSGSYVSLEAAQMIWLPALLRFRYTGMFRELPASVACDKLGHRRPIDRADRPD
jgi:hypothetical protein